MCRGPGIAELAVEEMDLKFDRITDDTDSKVVLGYIHNQARRFYVFVNNRVQHIRQFSSPDQWRYVPTDHNPADQGSRSVSAACLSSSTWFSGPDFLQNPSIHFSEPEETFDLVNPLSEPEIRPLITANVTKVPKTLMALEIDKQFP